MIFLYQLFIRFYLWGIRLAALWNPKARLWAAGRRQLWPGLEGTFPLSAPLIWIHSASAGEFEQAKPVIAALRKDYPEHRILATFFSPSGYSAGKKSGMADHVFYLPPDRKRLAARFVQLTQPVLVVFVKYDFWYYHLQAVRNQKIPLLLISANFRKDQAFFKWYGGFYRRLLHFFTRLFVQDAGSLQLLQAHGIGQVSVGGDTRFDRVAAIAAGFSPLEDLQAFAGNSPVIVAGSTWPEDEAALATAVAEMSGVKLVVAPHEMHSTHLQQLEQRFAGACFYSRFKKAHENSTRAQRQAALEGARVLVIDSFGLLSRLYHYATITYIGGGFNKSGIHNTLEAAVYGKPVVFGPHYQKFREARELIAAGGAFSYTTAEELEQVLQSLLQDAAACKRSGMAAFRYVQDNRGATERILAYIQENRLLTS